MSTDFHIHPTEPHHNAAIEAIIAAAFGNERAKRHINIMRKDCLPYGIGNFIALSTDDKILGSIRYYLAESASGHRFPFLGPLAVLPHLRGQGIGKALIATSLQKLHASGHDGILIVGDTGYYAPFGFSPKAVSHLDLGGAVAPLAFMGLEKKPQAVSQAHGKIHFIKKPEEM